MQQLHVQKTAVSVGLFLGAFHLVWAALVGFGWAQAIYDFILWAHMIRLPLTVGPFELTAAAALIVLTFVIGYVFGFAFAYIWNTLHKEA